MSSSSKGNLVRPVPGPGDGITRAMLKSDIWDKMDNTWVLGFYGDRRQYGCFSNFYAATFDFVVPEEVCAFPLSLQQRTVSCDFSEKAIMLCKAAAMGDQCSYNKIKESKAGPPAIKKMGREVQGFNDGLWKIIECSVAYEVVYQKFLKVKELGEELLSTEDWVIAEATSNDKNWGIGLDMGDKLVHQPRSWKGTNMLGWALMEARKSLRSAGTSSNPGIAKMSVGAFSASSDSAVNQSCDTLDTKKIELMASPLTAEEKNFLKIAKKCRAIIQLEELRSAGKTLDKLQTNKLEESSKTFAELSDAEEKLPSGSDLRSKNEDVLVAMRDSFAKA